MEYVKVFPCDAENSVSRPGGATRCAEKKFFEPRSPGGTGILRDIVQVSEACPLSSYSPFSTQPSRLSLLPPNFSSSLRSSLFARFLFRLHGPRLYALPPLPLSLSLCRLFNPLHTRWRSPRSLSLSPLSCTFYPL